MKSVKEYLEIVGAIELYHEVEGNRLSVVRLEPGMALCNSGDPVKSLYLLVEGSLNVTTLSADGRYGSVARAITPQMIGDMSQ